ncbi:MAG: hypothetical protein EOO09_02790 [Chitinophagaceae bacterium]|nr:MAG: hypothetical protein EOO09_02790 [Chitinophagaceae bacterium]
MKKITLSFSLLLLSIAGFSQDQYDERMHMQSKHIEIVAMIGCFVLVVYFVLALLNRILDHRLRNKVIDRQVTENMALNILGTHEQDQRFINVKWFAILAGIGIGLLVVNYTQPYGLHSLAIMFLSIAASFLGYHLFLTAQRKKA